MGATYTNVLLHLVFGTKNRAPTLTDEIQPRLHEYLGGIIRSLGGSPLGIGGAPDHVHILFAWHAAESIAKSVQVVKAKSSGWLKRQFPELKAFEWQSGYAVFSVSQSQAAKVRAYIGNQAVHHRKVTFRDELIKFLEANGIKYYERHIWS